MGKVKDYDEVKVFYEEDLVTFEEGDTPKQRAEKISEAALNVASMISAEQKIEMCAILSTMMRDCACLLHASGHNLCAINVVKELLKILEEKADEYSSASRH